MPKTTPPPRQKRSSPDTAPKRTYLSREVRRQALLETAADIVERNGWNALTMSALAEQGGTSRQLIYQHFPSLEKLLADTAWHIFNDTMQGTAASVAANPNNLAEAARAAEAVTLDLPPGRGDALWQLIAGTASTTPELEQIRQGLRELIISIWTPLIRKELGLNTADAKAYAWMTVMAFWGMRQLVRDGAVTRARGIKLFNELVERTTQTPAR
ncbi:TetR/AcrR family transcriptional regulator [Sinimarinibacterium sp. CAU 1509]|uniref:TetR/AcrR family transcriptional regulator n=1 Tax=Sinimarinibacterium sp. CAU 1509 TaxID=2562283 RepID=UPI0010AC5947|nr:TetR/AcrR family transcriptional regulator [Sinimarinibacterium sp. CAU 1509]TJY62283.1 TetR/AcrR family transcriptional regulator [Sinimarinibacterium sp. CAU 1509]